MDICDPKPPHLLLISVEVKNLLTVNKWPLVQCLGIYLKGLSIGDCK
jgi:hypothetical protein